jgi:hypothetical protein
MIEIMFRTTAKDYLKEIVLGFLISFLFLLALSASVAYADTSANGSYGSNYDCNGGINGTSKFVPLACYAGATQVNNALNSSSLPQYINSVFTIVLSIGAMLAVLRIAYGGYIYMGSADMWGNKQQAKEIIGDAIIGLLLLFAIYLILYQINPNLLNLNVLNDIQKVPTTSSTPTATTCQSANCTGVNDSGGVTSANAGGTAQQIGGYQATGYGGN